MDLQNIELFSSLSPVEIKEIQKIARRVHMSRGEIIFHEGDYEKNIYIIETGQIEIFKRSPVHGEQSLAILKNGDYFGEMAFFEKAAARSAAARTLQATVLIMIEAKDFERLIHSHPTISLRLLATLSQRLRVTNKMISSNRKAASQQDCQIITVASAKDGYGKTTLAASLAKMLTSELNKKILFVDLDLYFASGTHLMGVHSPRSIVDISNKANTEGENFEIKNELVRQSDNLWVVPAPRSFLDAEHIHSSDIIKILKECKKDFDYIIVDTGSIFDENLFTVLDTADYIFFLINFANLSTITDNVRFFQGISKLSYPKERIILLGNNIGPDFSSVKTSKIFPYPVIGGLPQITDYTPQFGKPPYDINPSSPYCEVIRLLVRNILKETSLKKPQSKAKIFSLFFGDKDPEAMINLQLDQLQKDLTIPFSPIINARDVRSQVKYVRYNLLFGYLQEAKSNLLSFMEYSQTSAPLCELLGEIYLLEGLTTEALEAFQKAVSLDPKQHIALGYLGILTGKNEKLQEALNITHEKIKENPTHLDLLNDLGKILMKNEEYEKARVHFEKALENNPHYLEAKINLSQCMAKLDQSTEAIELLLNIKNKNPRIFFTLGEIFYSTGRLYLSYRSYSKAVSLYPGYPGIRPRLTELSNYLRKLETVIDLHERFVNTNPDFPDLHAKLASFYHLAGKSEIAIEEYKKALELNPDYKDAEIKLDRIHKDIIWRLAKTHLEEELEDYQLITKSITANVHFIFKQLKKVKLPEEAVLQIKNIRTSKVLQKVITATQIDQGFIRVDCSPLGLIACQDILLTQIVNAKTKKILRFAPHYIEKEEITSNLCDIKLNLEQETEIDEIPEICTKFFLVHLTSKHFAHIIGSDESTYKAKVTNVSNGLEAIGHLNPENDEQINFVLNGTKNGNGSSGNGKSLAAVNSGDKLSIRIEDGNAEEVFSMEFAVGNSDLKNFCKTIIPQDIS
jgi:CRP-like cAMP-binding protein/tetratricopeptide (TPR) repeat protein